MNRSIPQFAPTIWPYHRTKLRRDVAAAIVVWAVAVPQVLAYADLVGLESIIGLWAAVGGLIGYALFGGSTVLSIGPGAASAAVTGSVLTAVVLEHRPSVSYTELSVLLTLMVAVFFLAASALRLGFLVDFIAEPVVVGYMAGLGLTVVIGQVPKLFGVDARQDELLFRAIYRTFEALPDASWRSPLLGFTALAILLLARRFAPRFPTAIIVVGAGTAITYWLGFGHPVDIDVVGQVEPTATDFGLPDVGMLRLVPLLIPGAAAIFLVSYLETMSVARKYAQQRGETIDPDQELLALGVASGGSALLGGFSVDGSVTRTAAADGAGMRTQLAGLILAALLLLTIFVLSPVFEFLPTSVLAAVVIAAVWNLLAARPFLRLRRLDRFDFTLAVASFIGVALLGAIEGLLAGIAVSLGGIVYRSYRPRIVEIGEEQTDDMLGGTTYRNVASVAPVVTFDGLVILRFEQELNFSNVRVFADEVLERSRAAEAGAAETHVVLIDATAIPSIDATAMVHVGTLLDRLEAAGTELWLAGAREPLRDGLARAGLRDRLGRDHLFDTIEDGVAAYHARFPGSAHAG